MIGRAVDHTVPIVRLSAAAAWASLGGVSDDIPERDRAKVICWSMLLGTSASGSSGGSGRKRSRRST